TSASALTKTRMASAFADEVTSPSSRSTPGGLATTRTFIPSFRFIFFAGLIDDRPPFVNWRPHGVRPRRARIHGLPHMDCAGQTSSRSQHSRLENPLE